MITSLSQSVAHQPHVCRFVLEMWVLAGSREDLVLRHRLLASYCVLCLTDRQSSLGVSSEGTDLVLKGFPLITKSPPLLISLC